MDLLSGQQSAVLGTLGDCLQTCISQSHWWTDSWACLVPSWIHTSGFQEWRSHIFIISVEKCSPSMWLKFAHWYFHLLHILPSVCYLKTVTPSHFSEAETISARACEWSSRSWCFCPWKTHWKSFLSRLTESSCAFSDCKNKWQTRLRRGKKNEWERAA